MASGPYADPLYRHARRYWASRVALGDVECHLCGRLIPAGPFHLDHVRGRPGDLHPAHVACNTAEGARFLGTRRGTRRVERGNGRLS